MPIVASKLVEISSKRSLGIVTKLTSRRNKKNPNMRLGGACRKFGNSKLPSSGSAAHCTSADRRSSQKYDIRHAMWPCTCYNAVQVKSRDDFILQLYRYCICKMIQVYSINMRSTNQENMQLAHWLCLLGYWLRCRVGTHHLRPCKVARIEGTEKPDGKWRTEKHGKTATGKITVHGEPLHPIPCSVCLPEYHPEPSNHCDIKRSISSCKLQVSFTLLLLVPVVQLCNQGARFLQHAKVHLAFPDQKRHCSLHQFALITRCHNTKNAAIKDLIFKSGFGRCSLYLQTCRLNVPWTNNDKYQLEDIWLHPSSKTEKEASCYKQLNRCGLWFR